MLKLSEAIYIGSKLSRQCKGKFDDGDGGTCALGAAGWAHGLVNEDLRFMNLWSIFPVLHKMVIHPELKVNDALYHVITDLNDNWNWTREQISEYVERVEDNEPGFVLQEAVRAK